MISLFIEWVFFFEILNQNNLNDYAEIKQKKELNLYVQRHLEALNLSQLHFQFDKPPINVYENM